MEPAEALLSIREVVERHGDLKVIGSYYLEFHRRKLVLRHVREHCGGTRVVDVGASPFLMSCALRAMGYEVVAVDYDPSEYGKVAEACGVKAVRADLERDKIPVKDGWADCVVFTEVLEHINPYYISHTLSEINRVLKPHGKIVVTTPNIASLFRRLRLLVGRQPQYSYHVHEYTKDEVEELLRRSGFKVLESYYSDINDLTFLEVPQPKYLTLGTPLRLIQTALRHPTKVNLLRAAAYPVVKLIPSTRMLIVTVAQKEKEAEPAKAERWE